MAVSRSELQGVGELVQLAPDRIVDDQIPSTDLDSTDQGRILLDRQLNLASQSADHGLGDLLPLSVWERVCAANQDMAHALV
jgi:hypothetical protein